MSELQYYEFAAVDGPISDEGLRYARACSSRAEVSPFRWRNVYHFGSFHGSVDTLLQHYDAHFYIANLGSVRLALALPQGCLKPEAIESYLHGGEGYEDTLTTKQVGNRHIVWWERNEEGGWWQSKTIEVRQARLDREAKAAAEKRKLEEEARQRHLTSVLQRADSIWASLDGPMAEKIASAYDRVAAQLTELRDAYEQVGERVRFQEKLALFRERYARRSAMMRRIERL
ncbi:MAG: hypothetical protein FJ387_14685 [Verrucomicrobia bacterium]|nr:hypothetical protein [Verrucomicrobiota bacterium]